MSASGLGGHLTFNPRERLTETQRSNLRIAFMDRTRADGAENGTVAYDWWCNNADGPPYNQREVVTFYCDGADDENPSAMLYRTGTHAGGFPASTHVPPPELQDQMGALGFRLWQDMPQLVENLKFLDDYLTSVLNDENAWSPLDINADPFADERRELRRR